MVGVMITDKITEETTKEITIDKIMDDIIIENRGRKVKVMHLYSTFQMGNALPKTLYM